MKNFIVILCFIFLFIGVVYAASTFTNNLGLEIPAEGDTNWDDPLRANAASLDTVIGVQHTNQGLHRDISGDAITVSADTVSVDRMLVIPYTTVSPDRATEGPVGWLMYDSSLSVLWINTSGDTWAGVSMDL